jgi:hypothetical protein
MSLYARIVESREAPHLTAMLKAAVRDLGVRAKFSRKGWTEFATLLGPSDPKQILAALVGKGWKRDGKGYTVRKGRRWVQISAKGGKGLLYVHDPDEPDGLDDR